MPAWVGADGFPLSWRHYQHGLAYARRKRAKDQLAFHRAIFMTKAKDEDRKSWVSELETAAGYRDL